MACSPPSVIHGAQSGPTITPCGADPVPSSIAFVVPVLGSSQPSSPESCAVYQTPPSRAGATSCGPWPGGNGNSCMANWRARGDVPGDGGATVAAAVGMTTGGDAGGIVGDDSARVAAGVHAISADARAVMASFIRYRDTVRRRSEFVT